MRHWYVSGSQRPRAQHPRLPVPSGSGSEPEVHHGIRIRRAPHPMHRHRRLLRHGVLRDTQAHQGTPWGQAVGIIQSHSQGHFSSTYPYCGLAN